MVLFVLFWYTKYSSISVSITVQNTHCKPIYVQMCNWDLDQDYCIQNFRALTNSSLINFPHIDKVWREIGDVFSFDEKCIVDSESENKKAPCEFVMKSTHKYKCRTTGKPKDILKGLFNHKDTCTKICPSRVHIEPYMPGSNMILKYEIKAFLKYAAYVGNEYVFLQGKILSVNNKQKVKYYKKKLHSEQKQQDSITSITVKVQTKWSQSLFSIIIQNLRWSKNWADVKIEIQNKSLLYISEQVQATSDWATMKTVQKAKNETLFLQILNPYSGETSALEAVFYLYSFSFGSTNPGACHSFSTCAKLFKKTLISTHESTHVFSMSDLIDHPLSVAFPNWDKSNQTNILLKAAWIPNQFHWYLNKLQPSCISYLMETQHCAGTELHHMSFQNVPNSNMNYTFLTCKRKWGHQNDYIIHHDIDGTYSMNSIITLNDPRPVGCKNTGLSDLIIISWVEAYVICKVIGGALPSFYSRENLEGFISLVRHTSCGWPPGIFYIGLQTSANFYVSLIAFLSFFL